MNGNFELTRGKVALAPVFLALALSAPGHAGVIFSNIALDCGHCGVSIQGQDNTAFSLAAAFTPDQDFSLAGAKARFLVLANSTVDFAIFSNSGNLPGAPLALLGSVNLLENTSGIFAPSGPIPSLDLLAGEEYWLVLTPATGASLVGWQADGTTFQPFAATHDATGLSHWAGVSPQSAQFEIDGAPAATAIPEPGNAWLLMIGIGSVGLMYAKRTRRRRCLEKQNG